MFVGVPHHPNSKHRVEVTPAKRGKGRPHEENEDKTPAQRHQSMTWAQRLKRVFNIDVSICQKCGGGGKVIACIEDQAVIGKILRHLNVDKNLCASELVEAEGDETKRKAKYIELRANQLYAQKHRGSQPIISLASLSQHKVISGRYVVNILYNDKHEAQKNWHKWYFGRDSNIEIIIKQDGDVIVGSFFGDRTCDLEGIVLGSRIKLDWHLIRPSHSGDGWGTGELLPGKDRGSLEGTWKTDYSGSSVNGKWTFYKIE